jgi:hypothetical protein
MAHRASGTYRLPSPATGTAFRSEFVRQDLYLQRRSRPEQSDQRQPNQAANVTHQPRASPDSTSLASRIEFSTMKRVNVGYGFTSGEGNCRNSELSADPHAFFGLKN